MLHFMRNQSGVLVKADTLGASIRSVLLPDRRGLFQNVALTYPAGAPSGSAYAGATLGPCAGRIPGGHLFVGEKTVQLDCNDGANHLHGGSNGLSDLQWRTVSADSRRVVFSCKRSPHDDGYPGNRRFVVSYELSEDALTIRILVSSDEATIVNPSNHVYWNLTGDFSQNVGAHQLSVLADEVYENDESHLPVRRRSVDGTVFDFRRPRLLDDGRRSGDAQIAIAKGYNHLFVLGSGTPDAMLFDPQSGRTLSMTTNAPAMVLYEGGFLSGVTEEGGAVVPCGAVALEPQRLPLDRRTPLTDSKHPYELWIRYTWRVM